MSGSIWKFFLIIESSVQLFAALGFSHMSARALFSESRNSASQRSCVAIGAASIGLVSKWTPQSGSQETTKSNRQPRKAERSEIGNLAGDAVHSRKLSELASRNGEAGSFPY